jgi:hypothetical protein
MGRPFLSVGQAAGTLKLSGWRQIHTRLDEKFARHDGARHARFIQCGGPPPCWVRAINSAGLRYSTMKITLATLNSKRRASFPSPCSSTR